jgi:transposase
MASGDVDRLRDDQWERLRDLVPGGREGQRGLRCDNRLFVDALLWMARSGARWRDLPERFGDHQAVKRRYYRWIARKALGGFLAVLTAEADLEWLMIDSTIVRAHQHAAGARIAKGGLMLRDWAAPAAA